MSSLAFHEHVNNIFQSCYFYIKALLHFGPRRHTMMRTQLACAMVDVRLDYCNSLLYGKSAFVIYKRYRVQITLAMQGFYRKEKEIRFHLTFSAKLHWLPITHGIGFKAAMLTFTKRRFEQSRYLASLINLKSLLQIFALRALNCLLYLTLVSL